MLGVIALPDASLSERDSTLSLHPFLLAELEEFRLQGGSGDWPYNNGDGWAMTSFSMSGSTLQVNSTRSELEAYSDDSYYDQTDLLLTSEVVSVLLGHVRQSTSGAYGIANPHPFIYQGSNGEQFCFGHNGDLDKDVLRELIGDDWLQDHPPQTYGVNPWDGAGWDDVVDSELFFFWIMKNIEEVADVVAGICQALIILEDELPSQIKNFLFSDGIDLIAYRSSPAADIFYFDGSNPDPPWYLQMSNHRAIMSTPPPTGDLAGIPWINLTNKHLIILKSDGSTELFDVLNLSEISEAQLLPTHTELLQAYPNPFNATTIIPVKVEQAGTLQLNIYDILGRKVYESSRFYVARGFHQLAWNGRDNQGNELGSGNYFFTVQGTRLISSGKLLLLK